ncbi:MAG: type VI secretion system baseplate subunit TssG [Terriglobus roseus]|nr:type VI secretion system baseplate subunit TssG [Terriglobus roseus]
MLRDQPWPVRFFQMVRLLERLHPERRPVGIFVAPADEVARFAAHTSFSFPASEIQSYTEGDNSPDRLSVNFMGLSTMNGPLPAPYTEMLLERVRAKDHAMGEFFDIFNHRILSLFYRGWKKYRFYIAYEQSRGDDDLVTRLMYDLLGLGTEGLRDRSVIADEAKIFYGGLLNQSTRTAQGLQQILSDYFQVSVEVQQFTGSWNRLPSSDHTLLNYGSSDSERLGYATVIGDEVWDQQGTLSVRLGPMRLARYLEFLPGGQASEQLADWLRFYGRREFDFVIQLVLDRNDVPPIQLSSDVEEMPRLGFASWLKNKPFVRDPDEATYRLY